MIKSIIQILLSGILVYLLSNFLPGVSVDNLTSAVVVALVLSFLNIFVKPILILLTLPATIFTFGLFLLVINGFVILICKELVEGFHVSSFGSALLFSLVLSLFQSILFTLPRK